MARDDDETPWTRQLLISAGVLLAVAVVIGIVVGAVAVGAAKVAGLGQAQGTATAQPSLYVPSGRPTVGLEPYPDPTGGSGRSPSAAASSRAPAGAPSRKPRAISLQALPRSVAPNQRITLTGVYRGHEGASLQVQRFESGRWTDFPVRAAVTGGVFATYITTGRTGVNRIRVVDPGSRAISNAVRVTVR